MQISKEFLLEAFGLSLLVAFLLISVQIFQRTTKITDLVKEEQEQQIIKLEEQEITQYDGLYLDGMAVISYIKNVVGNYELPVTVTTERTTYVVNDAQLYSQLRLTESEYYINPLALYFCEVIRDENDSITEVVITSRKGEE